MLTIDNCSQISLIILIIIFIAISLFKPGALENWEVYKQKPLGYVKTGSDPLAFYERPRYRKPYKYPAQFRQSYPYDHMSYLP
jgi:hypothetical protein